MNWVPIPYYELNLHEHQRRWMKTSGYNRDVLLAGRYAVKTPRLDCGWLTFCIGLVANGIEVETWNMAPKHVRSKLLCPVIWNLANFVVVMQRCEPVGEQEAVDALNANRKAFEAFTMDTHPQNFGKLNDAVVLLDYG